MQWRLHLPLWRKSLAPKLLMPCNSIHFLLLLLLLACPRTQAYILRGQVGGWWGSKAVSYPKWHLLTNSGSLSLNKTMYLDSLSLGCSFMENSHGYTHSSPESPRCAFHAGQILLRHLQGVRTRLDLLCLRKLITKSWIAFDLSGWLKSSYYIVYFEIPGCFIKIS